MPSTHERDALLIAEFVATFAMLGDMTADETLDPIAWQFAFGEPDQYGRKRWRPLPSVSDPSCLASLNVKIPTRFPRLYERLLLTYRWAEVDLQVFRLLANPLGSDLSGHFAEISKDRFMWDILVKSGFLRFGKGPDVDYDPICFDFRSRNRTGDFPVVKIDHEEVLCNSSIKIVKRLADGFEDLVRQIIARADRVSGGRRLA